MAPVTTAPTPAASTRLVSLDVFRGLTMAGMVIVNNPGDWGQVYWPLLHAEWNGWTPTDLIFPFFLFIVGVAITFSRRSVSTASIVRRAAVIFAVGLFLAGFPRFDPSHWRIPGVLQRIAICYLVAGLLYRAVLSRVNRGSTARTGARGAYAPLGLIAALLMLGYWAAMMLIPVPGGTAGDLSPGRDLGAYIDRVLLSGHLYRPTWDPEGLVSTVPAIATTFLGTLAGLWMREDVSPGRKAGLLALGGAVAIAIGEIWNVAFPINKNLWTSSYVMFTAGAAALFLALCYWIVDVKQWRRWATPFVILGMNALALYAFSALLVRTMMRITITPDGGTPMASNRLIYTTFFEPFFAPKNASLAYALANLGVLFLVLLWMYRRKIFLKA
jgi:predicted acyltransferase